MRTSPSVGRIHLLLLACALAVGGSSASAQVLVLSASGPAAETYRAGSVLHIGQVVVLKAGDRLSFLDDTGTHLLAGPSASAIGQSDPRVRSRILDLFRNPSGGKPAIVGARGTRLLGRRSSALWEISDMVSGVTCFSPGYDLSFRDDHFGAQARALVLRDESGRRGTLDWSGDLAKWPPDVPVVAGARYKVTMEDGSQFEITLRSTIAPTAGLLSFTSDLFAKGCRRQLARLQEAAWQEPGS